MKVEVIAHSVGPSGVEIITIKAEFPKFLLAMLREHKEFSITEVLDDNSVREQVANDPALPVLWPKQHKGMQGTEVFEKTEIHSPDFGCQDIEVMWLGARNHALKMADSMSEAGLSKQLTNRLLERYCA